VKVENAVLDMEAVIVDAPGPQCLRHWASSGVRMGLYMHRRRGMNLFQARKTTIATLALLVGCAWASLNAQSTAAQPKPDNTAVNKRDRNPGESTADQQKINPGDRALTAKIRSAVMADKALSTYAHNVKIISQDGIVTLKGPVRSNGEVESIVSKATASAGGSDKVVNQLTVKP
jgi:hyperosmotically inducible periplasmic protein